MAKERINLLPFYMTDVLFTELQIHKICEKNTKIHVSENVCKTCHKEWGIFLKCMETFEKFL